jgi:tricorn protease
MDRKVMLINELAGSGGDAMPWFFKKLQVGPLIGKRTWGGLVRASGIPTLMDGGNVRAPNGAVYGFELANGKSRTSGVAPDIETELDPAGLARGGRDLQLEKGCGVVARRASEESAEGIQTSRLSGLSQRNAARSAVENIKEKIMRRISSDWYSR